MDGRTRNLDYISVYYIIWKIIESITSAGERYLKTLQFGIMQSIRYFHSCKYLRIYYLITVNILKHDDYLSIMFQEYF